MRYFVANLIRGEAAEYYKVTSAELASRFGVPDISSIVPPHITVKSPFDLPKPELVERLCMAAANASSFPIFLSGWNHFGNQTIFIDIPKHPPELIKYMKDVLDKFRAARIPVYPREYDLHIHLSIARFLTPQNYQAVHRFLTSAPKPSFDISFDNLTILSKEKDARAWKVWKTYPLLGQR